MKKLFKKYGVSIEDIIKCKELQTKDELGYLEKDYYLKKIDKIIDLRMDLIALKVTYQEIEDLFPAGTNAGANRKQRVYTTRLVLQKTNSRLGAVR